MDTLLLLLLLAALLLPAVLVLKLRGTPLFWLPGTVLLVGAGALFILGVTIPAGGDAAGAVDALAAGLAVIGAGILLVYGLICLVVARAPQRSMPPPVVPEAFVVRAPWHRD